MVLSAGPSDTLSSPRSQPQRDRKTAILNALIKAGPGVAHPLGRCGWFDFPVMHDARGNLTVIEGSRHVPFNIERLYFLYDIPSQAERAGHAHRVLTQVFIAMSGSFDLHLDDGVEQRTIHLNRANRGYIVRPWTWRTLDNFSGNSVCLVLADRVYDEADYIRDHASFLDLARRGAAAWP